MTLKSSARSAAATSSASFFGLSKLRLGFLYCELPTTSATRRSAKDAPFESSNRAKPHRNAIPVRWRRIILHPVRNRSHSEGHEIVLDGAAVRRCGRASAAWQKESDRAELRRLSLPERFPPPCP